MDAQGWVDIAVVAGFKRVQGITRDVGMVKDALLYSLVLDVDEEGMKVRKRYGWEMYTLQSTATATGLNGSVNGYAYGNGGGDVENASGNVDSGNTSRNSGSEGEEKGDKTAEDDEPALGVVAASGLGGTLEA